jgi:tetratricopeptide (TPR) repeat protein
MSVHTIARIACALTIFLLITGTSRAAAVPEEAEKYMVRGMAASETATDKTGYLKAAGQFELAAKVAPEWPNPYLNLGLVYEKAGNLEVAMANYKTYLKLAPTAPNAKAVKTRIYKLEYLMEDLKKFTDRYVGIWEAANAVINIDQREKGLGLLLDIRWGNNKVFGGQTRRVRLDIPNIEIADDRFEYTGPAKMDQWLDRTCFMQFVSMRGISNSERSMDIELNLEIADPNCTISGPQTERYVFTKGNFTGIAIRSESAGNGLIMSVTKDSPAEKVGIKELDTVISYNGIKFGNLFADYEQGYKFTQYINRLPKDAELKLAIRRKGYDGFKEHVFRKPY